MTQLSVNINKIALLRNSRGRDYPDPIGFSKRCLELGAHGITLHPRPDQRHARYDDIFSLRKVCDQYQVELNVEGYPSDLLIQKVMDAKPDQFTLVPDTPNQLTSDHGWDFKKNQDLLKKVIDAVQPLGIRVSLFADYNNPDYQVAKEIGADRLELYTEPYAETYEKQDSEIVLEGFLNASKKALDLGLELNAGHDLNLENLQAFIKHIPSIKEVSIGHALIVECLEMGIETVIGKYLEALKG